MLALLATCQAQLSNNYYTASSTCKGTCTSSYVFCGNTTGNQQQPKHVLLNGTGSYTAYATDTYKTYTPNFRFFWFGTNYGLGGSSGGIVLNTNFQILFGVNSAARPNPTTPSNPGRGIAFGQGVQRGSHIWYEETLNPAIQLWYARLLWYGRCSPSDTATGLGYSNNLFEIFFVRDELNSKQTIEFRIIGEHLSRCSHADITAAIGAI